MTTDEITRVKAILLLKPETDNLYKWPSGVVVKARRRNEDLFSLDSDLFPSISPGEQIKLSEILEAAT